MSQNEQDDELAPAASAPNMKIMLVTAGEIPQILKEWRTAYWPGYPSDTYDIDGDTWETKSFSEEREPDDMIVYRVRVARVAPTD